MIESNRIIKIIYKKLSEEYGPQGWWPLLECEGGNPTKTGSLQGYHPGDYSYPRNGKERFEICIGAVLTQNTAWPNVEKALWNLEEKKAISPETIIDMDEEELRQAIRPAGYFNQKAERLKILARWFLELGKRIPDREELLGIKGIGPETADSILLYAFSQPSFVVDAYTRRIFLHLGLIRETDKYDDIKKLFEDNLEADTVVFQEYHALLVEHAKRHYGKEPYGEKDILLNFVRIKKKFE